MCPAPISRLAPGRGEKALADLGEADNDSGGFFRQRGHSPGVSMPYQKVAGIPLEAGRAGVD
jgi:hypothetical protein